MDREVYFCKSINEFKKICQRFNKVDYEIINFDVVRGELLYIINIDTEVHGWCDFHCDNCLSKLSNSSTCGRNKLASVFLREEKLKRILK